MTTTTDIDELLTRGVAEVVPEAELRARLARGTPLRLKQGFDPTKPDMHIGHAVGLRKLRRFQELGHQVVLIVGDWTAQIGDPSGRDEARPQLDAATVKSNAETYLDQFFKVVDRSRTEIRWQSEWFGTFDLERALWLAGRFTVAQMLAHETFRKRYESGARLSVLELMYPMLQGYDSVMVKPDVEFGGTDQKFNNLAGRDLMQEMHMEPQSVLLVPLIPGTDGRKMSKTFNNTVDLLMPPLDMFGRVMSMGDDVLPLYFEVLSDVSLAEIADIRQAITSGSANPMEFKKRLGREIVTQFHDAQAAQAAETEWVNIFSKRERPTDMPEHTVNGPMGILDLMVSAQLAPSKSEAKRLINGGGVKIDDVRVDSMDLTVDPTAPIVMQVGRRKFVRVRRV